MTLNNPSAIVVGCQYEQAVINRSIPPLRHVVVGQSWHNTDMSGPLETEITTSMIVWQWRWVPDRSGSLETKEPTEGTRKVVVD